MRFTRSSGILVHPTSLPGPFGSGDFGIAAYHFVDWLALAGQKLWQMLPLGPVGMGNSPYMGLSAFAGYPLLIDLVELHKKGWLTEADINDLPAFPAQRIDYAAVTPFRMERLRRASEAFFAKPAPEDTSAYDEFCAEQQSWLDDYALFMALVEKNQGKEWCNWNPDLVHRKPAAMKKAHEELQGEIDFWKFTQWCFFRQWKALKKYANSKGVKIVGDIPIFIAYQSADVWAHPELFYLNETDFRPTVVAGVPPDYFSATGQRWGNPLYRWDVMHKQNYAWWIERIKKTLEIVDIARIDHFRGFAQYWEIPGKEKTAVKGKWIDGPKEQLFLAIQNQLGDLPIIAEDLGMLTPDVYELRDAFEFPGMRILQFAFASDAKNIFLPHNYTPNTVVYTGTHDNDTTVGWFATTTDHERVFAQKYFSADGHEIHWNMMRAAAQSVADVAVYPLQDILGLGTEHRMNFPGKALGNWAWRFEWEQVQPWHGARLLDMTAVSGRCDKSKLDVPGYPTGKVTP
ncbi:MAG TPA: 4-alpha-glucanotransferase [Bacteroidota bacterium]|nr:4-alpha-glucanotransferase [Bacteroidota bacterium]